MTPSKAILLASAILLAAVAAHGVAGAQESTPTPTQSQPRFSATDVINTVNTLRITNGLAPLGVHPVLMQIAQTEANGIAAGYGGHWRPRNLTLGQWLLSLGYPLSGDLSMDGYRSENWFSASMSSTLEEVTQFWQGDAEHRDTMFSPDRSDIGAAVAIGEDGQLYVVLETALRTASGKMQYDAYSILTGIPQTQAAYSEMATLAYENGLLPQYSVPVAISTARPDGMLYHEVRYGQSLWSIAIAYQTTIKEIQSLNNLRDITVYEGQKLLVKKGATQPSQKASMSATPYVQDSQPEPLAVELPEASIPPTEAPTAPDYRTNALSFGAIAITGLFLAGVFAAMFRKRRTETKPSDREG